MTDNQINERVAALCGWKKSRKHNWWRRDGAVRIIPPYTVSLDLCRDLIDQIHGEDRKDFIRIAHEIDRLAPLCDYEHQWAMATMTPRELCECFLKLKGQWDEN